MKKKFCLIVGCIMLLAFFTPICRAASKQKGSPVQPYVALDSLMRAEFSDSIADIILNASKIEVSIVKKDSLGKFTDVVKTICNKDKASAIKFAMVASEIQHSDIVMFSPFTPYVKITFYRQKMTCTVAIDLGTRRLQIEKNKDGNIKTLMMNDNLLIKAASLIYPNDDFINFILKQK